MTTINKDVIQNKNALLSMRVRGVMSFDDELRKEAASLVTVCDELEVECLAANEVGLNKRMIAMLNLSIDGKYEEDFIVLCNPYVYYRSPQVNNYPERCWSVPGVEVRVERPICSEIRGHLPDGREVHLTAGPQTTQMALHAIDHLNGILIKGEK